MRVGYIRCLPAFFCALLLAVSTGMAEATAAGEIQEVKATPDCRRVIIKCQGRVGPPTAYELAEPSRLVIDFHARLGEVNPKREYVGKSICEIRAGKLPGGARLVVDFGENRVPQYQIRQIDNYFVVFLSDAPSEPAVSAHPVPVANAPMWEEAAFPETAASEPASRESSELVIRSARVVRGMIVLEVEDHSGVPRSFRVDIGVDFDQMGFHTAAVRRIKGATGRQVVRANNVSSFGKGHGTALPVQGDRSPAPEMYEYHGKEAASCLVSGLIDPQQNTW